jgi:NAD(P)-dependent dehydrogenase (short-subunit alcohol dehydrogenase family)
MGKLDGKVALVTGASRGIGQAISALFAEEGAKLVCTARTLEEGQHPLPGSLATTVGEIVAAGGEATAVAGDVSSYEECERMVAEAHAAYGPIDVLVNNAALTYFLAAWRSRTCSHAARARS